MTANDNIDYKVTYIVTPIQYATKLKQAIRGINFDRSKQLTDFDTRVLSALDCAIWGLRYVEIIRDIGGVVAYDTMNMSLDRLERAKYVTRTQFKARVTYTITTSGRAIIAEINQKLIELCDPRNQPQVKMRKYTAQKKKAEKKRKGNKRAL